MKNTSFVIAALVVAGGIAGLVFISQDSKESEVRNFKQCADAGYAIQESFPRKCVAPNGNSFVEPSSAATPAAPKEINHRAAFGIFTNNTYRIFTEPKYHNRSSEAFITAANPNIIHIKKEGVTWQQFFDTLPSPMKLTEDCLVTGTGQTFCNNSSGTLKFYLNGSKVDNLLARKINNGDKALVSYGPNDSRMDEQLQRIPAP